VKLTEAKLKEMISVVWREITITLPLPQGPVVLPIPKGFSERKHQKNHPLWHQVELMDHDKQRRMEISVDLKTGGIDIHIFVRNPDNKIFTFVATSIIAPGSSEEDIFEGYAEMLEELKNEKPWWM